MKFIDMNENKYINNYADNDDEENYKFMQKEFIMGLMIIEKFHNRE